MKEMQSFLSFLTACHQFTEGLQILPNILIILNPKFFLYSCTHFFLGQNLSRGLRKILKTFKRKSGKDGKKPTLNSLVSLGLFSVIESQMSLKNLFRFLHWLIISENFSSTSFLSSAVTKVLPPRNLISFSSICLI